MRFLCVFYAFLTVFYEKLRNFGTVWQGVARFWRGERRDLRFYLCAAQDSSLRVAPLKNDARVPLNASIKKERVSAPLRILINFRNTLSHRIE